MYTTFTYCPIPLCDHTRTPTTIFRSLACLEVLPQGPSTTQRPTRLQGNYKPLPYISHKYSKSFYPYYTKKWNKLHSRVRCTFEMLEFKNKLKNELKPTKTKHFSFGSKLGNILHTRLRLGRSYLKGHSFSIGMADSPECDCHAPDERTSHYLLDCFLYTIERQNLFNMVTQLLPNFHQFSRQKKLDTMLSGISGTDENHQTNKSLSKITQNFILKTNRFKY